MNKYVYNRKADLQWDGNRHLKVVLAKISSLHKANERNVVDRRREIIQRAPYVWRVRWLCCIATARRIEKLPLLRFLYPRFGRTPK